MHSEFTFHLLNEVGKIKANDIAEIFDECLTKLEHVCTPSREFSLTKTKLEEASFFAKKSMANDPKNCI